MSTRAILSLWFLMLVTSMSVYAQGSSERTIKQLQREIAQREQIDRDPNIPPNHKAINRQFLEERRAQLFEALRRSQLSSSSVKKYHAQAPVRISTPSGMLPKAGTSAVRPRTVTNTIANGTNSLVGRWQSPPSTGSAGQGAPKPAVTPPPSGPNTPTNSGQPAGNKQDEDQQPAETPDVKPSDAAKMPGPTQRRLIASEPRPIPAAALANVDALNAELFNDSYARELVQRAISADLFGPDRPNIDDKNFECIIHVMKWDVEKKEPGKQSWYVFANGRAKGFMGKWSQEDFAKNNRVFGVSRLLLLYVHLNNRIDDNYYSARYEFDITKKTPANLTNLFAVAKIFTEAKQAVVGPPPKIPRDVWGGGSINIDYVPSDVTISAKFVTLQPEIVNVTRAGKKVQAYSGRVSETEESKIKKIDEPKTFDNEGLYWWDVSVGVPFRHISQLSFESSNNTVTAKKVDRQNIFALVNLYPSPVDVKTETFSWIPHFIGGVAIDKHPQNKILLGAGFGPYFANFYVGAMLVREEKTNNLKEGDAASQTQVSADVTHHYKPKFSFGLNLPVRGVTEALKKASK